MLLVRPYRLALFSSVWQWSIRGASFSSSTGTDSQSSGATKEPQCKEVNVAVSSLRVDTVAAAGLDISRKHIWKAVMDDMVMLNGKVLKKKSTNVHEGDVVEVDSILNQNKKRKSPSESYDSDEETQAAAAADSGQSGEVGDGDGEVTVKRGRVVVKEIGEQTKKGGYHLTLVRHTLDHYIIKKMANHQYEAFLKRSNDLADLLQHQVVTASSQLLEKRLVSKELHDWVLTAQGVSNKEKAARLLSCVADQIKVSAGKYAAFLDVLKKERCFEDAVKTLTTSDDALVWRMPRQTSDTYDHEDLRHDHDITESDVECSVVTRMKKLDGHFRSLHGNLLSELESKKVPVRRVLNSLTLLPIELRQEYVKTISEKLPDLRREEEISDLFLHLNPLVSFIDHGLIKYIIDQFGSNTLKIMMTDFREDVVQFMKKTTVKQLMDYWPGQQEIPPSFSKLQAKIDEDPTTYTLYDLDQKRRHFLGGVRLTEVVLVLIGLKMSNSFIVEWLVPSALVPQLVESAKQLDFGFYLRERMLKMAVGEKQIFPFLPDSKPKVPALQTTAAMVTDVKDDEETDPAATQLSSSMEQVRSDPAANLLPTSMKQLSLHPSEQREVQKICNELLNSSLYSGVGIVYDQLYPWIIESSLVERTLSELNFKYIDLGQHIRHQVDLKTCLSTIAQSNAYPKTPSAAGSQPFVIAVFVTGVRGKFPGSLYSQRGESMDIVVDIIKPFLPKLAPHLAHISKLFFVSSTFHHEDLDTQPPSFPDEDDANYCIAYHLSQWRSDQRIWMRSMADGLCSGRIVQDVIEETRSHLDKDNEQLYTFSCLKDKLVLGK